MNTYNHIVIFSHGFGVRKDGRGLFTDIAAGLPQVKSVLFDYNEFDEQKNTLTIPPFSENSKRLDEIISREKKMNPNAVIDIVTHSQDAVIDALLSPTSIRRTIFIAPPLSWNIEKSLARYKKVLGAKINMSGVSILPRSDGSTTIIPREYWEERDRIVSPIALYNAVAETTDLIIIYANQDSILSDEVTSGLSSNIRNIRLDGDHDFNGPARPNLVRAVQSIIGD
ncbi:MAG: hypothetical protein UY04_C0039G0007 [Parcubacteria group bacterium GW2011_GWA2_47_7]|nr:MAG: hypothetical protein UY04_C0039G0007 [Parcubacteria group bacterium GW2011_GWA2_47_7]